ncbi:MAG: thioredoxin family protein, partial [Bacteroidales bacterium]|nr:thioredoxin family protein [Bacteroidales bacterium]
PEYAASGEATLKQGTLLEFGALSCISCRRMENVLQEMEGLYPSGLAIERVIITTDEGLKIMKRFGVLMIPTQVILDKQGAEVYRHTGFISTKDLSEIINKQLNISN